VRRDENGIAGGRGHRFPEPGRNSGRPEIGKGDTWSIRPGRVLLGVVGDSDDGESDAALEHDRRARLLDAHSRTDPCNAGLGQVRERVEQGGLAEVERVIVRECDAVDAEMR
jgi:hypothetical protein